MNGKKGTEELGSVIGWIIFCLAAFAIMLWAINAGWINLRDLPNLAEKAKEIWSPSTGKAIKDVIIPGA